MRMCHKFFLLYMLPPFYVLESVGRLLLIGCFIIYLHPNLNMMMIPSLALKYIASLWSWGFQFSIKWKKVGGICPTFLADQLIFQYLSISIENMESILLFISIGCNTSVQYYYLYLELHLKFCIDKFLVHYIFVWPEKRCISALRGHSQTTLTRRGR